MYRPPFSGGAPNGVSLFCRRTEDQGGFLVREASDALGHLQANIDVDACCRILGQLPIIDAPLQDCAERGNFGISDGFGAQSGVNERRLPAQKIIGREPSCVVVADERANMVQDAFPAVKGLFGRLLLRCPPIEQGLERNCLAPACFWGRPDEGETCGAAASGLKSPIACRFRASAAFCAPAPMAFAIFNRSSSSTLSPQAETYSSARCRHHLS